MLESRDELKISQRFGDILYRLREANQLSQREAAKLIGISQTRLVSLEHAKDLHTGKPTLPSPEITARIAAAYKYPREQLLALAGYMPWMVDEPNARMAVKAIADRLSTE